MVDLKKTFNGDGPVMVKPLKNNRWQWCLGKKTLPSHRSKKMTIVEVYCPHMLRSIFGPPEVPLLALFQFAVIFIEVAHMMRSRDSAQGNISHDESVFSST